MAMIINIGLFVKAKINLQNAVDAAAFSGAATQSRQLTDIAYLNWEMRNTYKEWMFKYYVLGNYSLINHTKNNQGKPGMDYTIPSLNFANLSTGAKDDIYNIPSVCIHFDNTTNLCLQYNIPGLPRFEANNFSGISDISETFLNVMTQMKSTDCSRRSLLNFLTTIYWAYGIEQNGTSSNNLVQDVPQIATEFPGAFPKAFELAIRIRNLEKFVNEPPQKNGVCFSPGNAPDGTCSQSINNFTTDPSINQQNERIVKAFYSAYRNLGNEFDNEMKESFTLTELPPSEVIPSDKLSFFPYEKPHSKFYLDLKIMPVNLATFFTTFVPSSFKTTTNGAGIGTLDSGCSSTKTALPIPGYPLGFYKDPNTLTYYAVKGQAKFVGLFNPFKSSSVTLTAYSAAKPFGGRIGPALYIAKNNSLYARTGSNRRTDPYAVSLQFDKGKDIRGNLIGTKNYALGAPVPMQNFWVQDSSEAVGGVPMAGNKITYVLPNMVYDLGDGDRGTSSTYFEIYSPPLAAPQVGLYNSFQVNLLKNLLGGPGSVDSAKIKKAILLVHRPTEYESKNWLIPSPSDFNEKNKLDAIGIVSGAPDSNKVYDWQIYAPLAGPGLEYGNSTEVINGLATYIQNQKDSVEAYLDSLKDVAQGILDEAPQPRLSTNNHDQAAASIYDLNSANPPSPVGSYDDLTCDSLAGKFYCYYFQKCKTKKALCPNSFKDEVDENWASKPQSFLSYYGSNFNYDFDGDTTPLSLFSAFSPGANQGADNNFNVAHPYLGKSELAKRNYYSAKFISVKSISKGAESNNSYTQNQSNFAIYSEGTSTPLGNDIDQSEFANVLDSAFTQEINSIKH